MSVLLSEIINISFIILDNAEYIYYNFIFQVYFKFSFIKLNINDLFKQHSILLNNAF